MTDRRRLSRRHRKELRHRRRRELDEQRPAWEAEAAQRLIDAHVRHNFVIHPLQHSFAYWQARRAGWDVLRPQWRQTGAKDDDGEPVLYEPHLCPVWVWWSRLTWRQRDDVSGEQRRRKRVSVDAVAVGLNNPLFEIEHYSSQ